MKLVKLTLGRDRLLWVNIRSAGHLNRMDVTGNHLALSARSGGALLVMCISRRGKEPPPLSLLSIRLEGLAIPGAARHLVEILIYFAEAGLFVFGSGLAIVPFLYGGVVQGLTG